MIIKTIKILGTIVVTALLLFYAANLLFGCPRYIPRAVFTYSLHPDFPLKKFVQGNLGVLQPTYARSYLVVAYRYLIGIDFDEEEQKAVLDLWEHRLGRIWDDEEEWVKDWFAVRNKVPGIDAPQEIEIYQYDTSDWFYYSLNCSEDAFRTACRTLNERIQKFGTNSSEVKEWVYAQDKVFANCSGEEQTIPDNAKPNTHSLIKADRAYQIASAHFYAGNFDTAKKMFERIAKDTSSPWRQIASYLVARTLIRKAMAMDNPDSDVYKDTLRQAEKQLKMVLNDKDLSRMHPAAEDLIGFIRFRLSPERLQELSEAVLKKGSGKTLRYKLGDYTILLSRVSNKENTDDLTDWVCTFKEKSNDALEHSLKKWKETQSLPWLIASLSKIQSPHPEVLKLLQAANQVGQESPAYLSVKFHRIRLMMDLGEKEECRKELDSLLSSQKTKILPSSLNLFLRLRTEVACNLDEFLKYSLRIPAGITYDYDCQELPVEEGWVEPDLLEYKRFLGCAFLDEDSTYVINRGMPLELLKEAVNKEILPRHLRQELALSAWVRAILLEDEKIGKELVPVLQNLVPSLKPYLKSYILAKNAESRKFAGIFAILNFPGMRPFVNSGLGRDDSLDEINRFHNNWWCALSESLRAVEFRRLNLSGYWYLSESPTSQHNFPDFLNERQKEKVVEEWKKLLSVDTAPNYLCSEVIKWAKKYPQDKRVPEALHLAVMSTRYGCTNEETSKFSKQAFLLLHKKYPKNSWTKETKYWY